MSTKETTENGIPYDWEYAGMEGARFWLLPTKGQHSKEQVEQAKRQLKRDHDVVGAIKVEWQ